MELKVLGLCGSALLLPPLESIQWNWKINAFKLWTRYILHEVRIHSMELKVTVTCTTGAFAPGESIQWNWKVATPIRFRLRVQRIHSMELKARRSVWPSAILMRRNPFNGIEREYLDSLSAEERARIHSMELKVKDPSYSTSLQPYSRESIQWNWKS